MTHEETLELVKPTIEHGPAYLAMVDDFLAHGEAYGYNNVELARADFATFIRELEDEARGIGLPPGFPAQQTYLLLKDQRLVIGEIRFRPALTPPYERFSGHIAYNITPSQRGKGYATRQLAFLLEEARKLHLPFVTLTIENDNPASARVIAKNDGRLLETIENPLSVRVTEQNGELIVEEFQQMGAKVALYIIELNP